MLNAPLIGFLLPGKKPKNRTIIHFMVAEGTSKERDAGSPGTELKPPPDAMNEEVLKKLMDRRGGNKNIGENLLLKTY